MNRAIHRGQLPIPNTIINLTAMSEQKPIGLPIDLATLRTIYFSVKPTVNIKQLSIAIRQHCLQNHQLQAKDIYLNFFLKCESKLKSHTEAGWRTVFEREINLVDRLGKIDTFISKKTLSVGFTGLLLKEKTQMKVDTLNKFCDEYENITVTEDVRIKTQFFFTWCQYIQHIRDLRMLRLKETSDTRKATTFRMFACKFASFSNWKTLTKRANANKLKGKVIKHRAERNLLTSIFKRISEQIEIRSIESLLENKIAEKMASLRKSEVFRKLETFKNKQKARIGSHQAYANIWAFRMASILMSRGNRLLSKSCRNVQSLHEKQYGGICVKMVFKWLKKSLQTKMALVSQLLHYTQTKNTKEVISYLRANWICAGKQKALILFKQQSHTQQYFRNFLLSREVNSEEKLKLDICRPVIARLKLESLLGRRSQMLERQRQGAQRKEGLIRVQLRAWKHRMFEGLRDVRNKNKFIKLNTYLFSKKIKLKRILKQAKHFTSWKTAQSSFFASLRKRAERRLIKLGFRNLSDYRRVKGSEKAGLTSICLIAECHLKRVSLHQLMARSELEGRLFNLTKAMRRGMYRTVFNKLVTKMELCKLRLKEFNERQQRKGETLLFSLLLRNLHQMRKQQKEARQIANRIIRRNGLMVLLEGNKKKKKDKKWEEKVSQSKKRCFYSRLFGRAQSRREWDWCTNLLGRLQKKKVLRELGAHCSRIEYYREEQSRKAKGIHHILAHKVLRHWRGSWAKECLFRNQQDNHFKSLVSILRQHAFRQIKGNVQGNLRHHSHLILTKIKLITTRPRLRFLTSLSFSAKLSILQRSLDWERKSNFLKKMIEQTCFDRRRTELICSHIVGQKVEGLRVLKKVTGEECEEREGKCKLLTEMLEVSRKERMLVGVIDSLRRSQALSHCVNRVKMLRLARSFGSYLKNCFTAKFSRVKQYISMCHYARNLTKTAFSALYKAPNPIVLKENRVRTEYNSFTRMEKSLDHNRKRLKLSETIERFNLRASRHPR